MNPQCRFNVEKKPSQIDSKFSTELLHLMCITHSSFALRGGTTCPQFPFSTTTFCKKKISLHNSPFVNYIGKTLLVQPLLYNFKVYNNTNFTTLICTKIYNPFCTTSKFTISQIFNPLILHHK